MAEHRITVQMDIIGTGDTDAAAQAAAGGAYVEMVLAFNRSYNGEAEPLSGGVPTDAAVLFARRQISRYISEVVVGWRRRKAQEDAEASVVTDGMVME